MSTIITPNEPDVEYPDSDGLPMAENTLQYEWIVNIKGNLDLLFADRPDVFVAGDNLIYPVRGDNTIRQAPDVYVAFGRPKGHLGSYRVWEEGGIFPQVVFEVWSPGNRAGEMSKKRAFYRRYGAQEYYVIDRDDNILEGWVRAGDELREVAAMNGFVSPLLGIRFTTRDDELAVYYPDGRRFLTFSELGHLEAEGRRQAQQERQRAEQERQRAEEARKENERLRELLRSAGIDPDSPR